MPEVKVNNLTFHYEDENFTEPWKTPDTVLIQHGYGRSSKFWYHWVPLLSGHFRVLRRDMRGHGQSQNPGPDYQFTVEDLLSDLKGFLDELGLDKVHYVGESLGGTLGLAFAAHYPERLKSLTVMGAPTSQSPEMKRVQAAGYKDWVTALSTMGSLGYAKAMVERGAVAGAEDPAHAKWVIENRGRTPNHVAVSLAKMVTGLDDISPILSTIKVPTLVIAPTDSAFLTLAHQVGIRDRIPGARIAVIEGPHELYAARPAESAAAILKFIGSLKS